MMLATAMVDSPLADRSERPTFRFVVDDHARLRAHLNIGDLEIVTWCRLKVRTGAEPRELVNKGPLTSFAVLKPASPFSTKDDICSA